MKFKNIIKKLNLQYNIISDNSKNDISNIVLNSKKSDDSTIFVCIKGFKTDGHLFLENSYINGCRDFIIENKNYIKPEWLPDSTIILANDNRKVFSQISNFLYDYPSNKLKMIGITGTKGKTTVATLIHLFLKNNIKTSLFTTVKNIIDDTIYETERTTMESNVLNSFLKKSYLSGEKISVVEVSSHAVTLKRVNGIEWDIGIFTSFSRDHLDLYNTMDNYFNAKLDFFRSINKSNKKNKIVFINMDDPKGKEVLSIIDKTVKSVKVGLKPDNDYFIKDYNINNNKILIKLVNNSKEYLLESIMHGNFNIINIALAAAVAMELKINFNDIRKALQNFRGVEGRFEIVMDKPFYIIIDYAHTPLSLQNILEEGRKLTSNKLYIVFGCTGERDVEKRSIMGEVAAKLSDFSFITNDDTYDEDPYMIAKEIEKGFIKFGKINGKEYLMILERKKAINQVINKAKKGDVIIIAGMGHEKIQFLKDGPVEYNDKDTVLEILKEKKII